MSNNVGDRPPHFPMRVAAFLEQSENYLQRGDIVLSRNRSLASRLIRFVTGGFFSHSALVFLVPRRQEGLDSTFVLESVSSGVGIGNFERWVKGPRAREEVAILRLQGEGLDPDFYNKVGGLMLEYVNSSYDYGLVINMAFSILFRLQIRISKMSRGRKSLRPWIPKTFICSGFIQYGLVEAMRRKRLDPASVVFKDDLNASDRDGLLAITPEDIATSEKPTWLYVIRRGWVYEAGSYAQAQALISSAQL